MEFEGFINVFKPEAFNKCKKDPLSWAWQVEGLAKCVYRIWAGWGRKLRTHGSRLTRVWHLGSNPAETRSYWCDGISDLIIWTHVWESRDMRHDTTCGLEHTYTVTKRQRRTLCSAVAVWESESVTEDFQLVSYKWISTVCTFHPALSALILRHEIFGCHGNIFSLKRHGICVGAQCSIAQKVWLKFKAYTINNHASVENLNLQSGKIHQSRLGWWDQQG